MTVVLQPECMARRRARRGFDGFGSKPPPKATEPWRVGPQLAKSSSLGGGFEPKPAKASSRPPPRHALGLEHHGHAQLPQHVEVASQSIGGLTQLPLFRPSVYQAPMAGRRRDPHSGLLPVGGLLPRPVEVFSSIDNHSSSESNEASPLALNLPLDECIVNTPICINQ